MPNVLAPKRRKTVLDVDTATENILGMQAGLNRPAILPFTKGENGIEFTAPEMVYQLARAFVTPGVAAKGGQVSPEDALNLASMAMGSGMGYTAIKPVQGKAVMGANVYHGSPHKFDQFDMSKIGTGEGAQAYGHGLYLADSPSVAKSYVRPEGKYARASGHMSATDERIFDLVEQGLDDATIFSRLTDAGVKIDKGKFDSPFDALVDTAAKIRGSGALYKVDLPDSAIEKMLDWDAPLSEQPEIMKLLGEIGESPEDLRRAIALYEPRVSLPGVRGENAKKELAILRNRLHVTEAQTGGEFYRAMSERGGGREAFSDALKRAGIPGIKYFDGMSRKEGKGTRNYVVFDDKLLKILERNGEKATQGFDAWRKSIWDDVKSGKFHPEEAVPDSRDIVSGKAKANRLFRAMSDNEWEAAQRAGAFRPLRKGDPDLYVTADPDRLSGGAYGAKGGGRIVEFDPVPVHKATGRLIDLHEMAATEIPTSKIRRVWVWDAKRKDHVLEYERK